MSEQIGLYSKVSQAAKFVRLSRLIGERMTIYSVRMYVVTGSFNFRTFLPRTLGFLSEELRTSNPQIRNTTDYLNVLTKNPEARKQPRFEFSKAKEKGTGNPTTILA